jgi:hypothetical protein
LPSASASVSRRSPLGCSYNRVAVSRNAPTVLALLLLTATATAFAVTQRLKLEPSPISQTHVAKVFSPVCECATQAAEIEFSLRRADHLRIAIQMDGREVTIANREFRRGPVRVHWDGRNAAGDIVPDGIYYPVVHMLRERRTIDLPNPIRVDTDRPTITLVAVRHDDAKTLFLYRTSERAHALLFVNGRRRVFTYSTNRHGRLPWYGRASSRTRLVLEAEDLAGNRSAPLRVHSV